MHFLANVSTKEANTEIPEEHGKSTNSTDEHTSHTLGSLNIIYQCVIFFLQIA